MGQNFISLKAVTLSAGRIPALLPSSFAAIPIHFTDVTEIYSRHMAASHKNKTFTTFLASVFGGIGLHRFYLRGYLDPWGWLHLAAAIVSVIALQFGLDRPGMLLISPLILSVLTGFLEALVLGLTPDDKWDGIYNPASGFKSDSQWPLALLLVLTAGFGAVCLIGTIARAFDLIYTGGAFG